LSTATTTALPSGIVTFVFTDIEGSTQLLHRLGEGYRDALERHREILRGTWEEHGGHVMSTEGDAFFVVFSSAWSAIRACADAQDALAREEWPQGAALRVRMGIHSGLASPQDGDYVTLAVHQAARVVSAGHGGQVIVSQAAVDALGAREGPELRHLGRFRLRDFDGPVELYEIRGHGEPAGAARAVPADTHNLVAQPTETIGREELVAATATELHPGRLITLVGPGGVGKTRVAAEVGLRSAPLWEDGVWLVDLADVAEPEFVGSAVAAAVSAPNLPGRERRADLLEHLAARRTVLILDNCEHVLTACAELASVILASCDGVAMLATSREPLHVPTETVRHVAPLAVPDGVDVRPEDVLASPAGRLFVERGVAVHPGFEVTADNAAQVASICRRLDGLPLLLELAAAHLSALSPAEILAGLEDRFRLLRSPSPLVSERHRTVDGLLGWSYDRLREEERAAFRRLSAFGGGFTLDSAAVAISGREGGVGEASHLVWTLVNRSLVTADLRADGTRYRLLETLRTYGRRLLDEAGEVAAVAVDLTGSYLEALGPWHQADQRWVGGVGAELDNLRALIPMLPTEHGELAQQIACSVGLRHDAVQSYREGIPELRRYVDELDRPSASRVSLLCLLAYLHLRTGEVTPAEELVDEAARVQEAHGAPTWDDVAIDRTRGEIARRSGDLERAVVIAREGLERPLSDRGRSRLWNLLGTTSAALGDLETAYEACAAELDLNRELGDIAYVASAHGNLAEVALRLGDVPTAAGHQRACLELGMAQGSTVMVAFSLIVAGRVAGARGDWATAAQLHARGEAFLEEIGLELYEDDRRESDELLARVRAELGEERAEQAGREGLDLDITAAVRMAEDALAAAGAEQV
jgi:predicted ATPase/class 3 adenylate cyclase